MTVKQSKDNKSRKGVISIFILMLHNQQSPKYSFESRALIIQSDVPYKMVQNNSCSNIGHGTKWYITPSGT